MSGGTIEYPNPYTVLELGEKILDLHSEYKGIDKEKIDFLVNILENLYEVVLTLDYCWSGDVGEEDFNKRFERFKEDLKERLCGGR